MTLHNYRLLCPTAFLFYKGKPFTHSLKHFFPWRAIANRVFHNSMLATFWLSVTIKSSQWLGTWKTCSRYIVFNKYAKDVFLQQPSLFNAAKFVIKPNFCFPAYGNVISAIREQFLYIGRLSEEKGISVLLDVFIKVPYRIKIAGAGPLKEKVMRYAHCFKNIEYVGEVAKENVAIIMQASTALIFPSVWHEGMPLTIIEAFAAGLPVISSNMGAMAQMIQHQYNGLHFKPGNEFDLITQLDQWQGLSFDERNHYRENALSTYESNYDPAINVKELMQIYSSVLADDGDLPLATTQHINYTPTILNRVA